MAVKKKVNIPDTKLPLKLVGKNNTLLVNNEVQDFNNKKCKLHSTTKNQHVNPIFINGIEKFHWIFKFKYLCGGGFTIEIDYNDNIVKFKEIEKLLTL